MDRQPSHFRFNNVAKALMCQSRQPAPSRVRLTNISRARHRTYIRFPQPSCLLCTAPGRPVTGLQRQGEFFHFDIWTIHFNDGHSGLPVLPLSLPGCRTCLTGSAHGNANQCKALATMAWLPRYRDCTAHHDRLGSIGFPPDLFVQRNPMTARP